MSHAGPSKPQADLGTMLARNPVVPIGVAGAVASLAIGLSTFGMNRHVLIRNFCMRSRIGWQAFAIFGMIWTGAPRQLQLHSHVPRDPDRWAKGNWMDDHWHDRAAIKQQLQDSLMERVKRSTAEGSAGQGARK